MTLKNNRSNEFKKWLTRKNLSYADFSERTGVQYNTVVGWSRGKAPRKVSKMIIKQKFPDCPLLKN